MQSHRMQHNIHAAQHADNMLTFFARMILYGGIFSAFHRNVIDFDRASAVNSCTICPFHKKGFYFPEQSGRHHYHYHHRQCLQRSNNTLKKNEQTCLLICYLPKQAFNACIESIQHVYSILNVHTVFFASVMCPLFVVFFLFLDTLHRPLHFFQHFVRIQCILRLLYCMCCYIQCVLYFCIQLIFSLQFK